MFLVHEIKPEYSEKTHTELLNYTKNLNLEARERYVVKLCYSFGKDTSFDLLRSGRWKDNPTLSQTYYSYFVLSH